MGSDRWSYDEMMATSPRIGGGLAVAHVQHKTGKMLVDRVSSIPRHRSKFVDTLNRGISQGKFPGMPTFSHPDQMRELLLTFHAAGQFFQSGCNTFRLSDGLAAMFTLTDVEIETEAFALPYPAFVINIPDGVVPYFGDQGQVWARHIIASTSISRRDEDAEDSLYYTQQVVTSDGRMMWSDWPIIDLVHMGGELLSKADAVTPSADGPDERDQLTGAGALRVVLNLARWLDRSGATKQADVRRVMADAKLRTWSCGESVSLRTELRRAAQERALGFTTGGWKLRQKHVVRGHWKMQVAGSDRAERKRIFVEPYWRGPDGAEAWDRVYEAAQ